MMKNPVRLVNRVNFEKELQEKKLKCEDMIRKYLPKEEGFAAQLAEAMNYSMEAGGKRLRPILMGETYRMFGGTSAIIEPFQAAMEMIHTSSLIHDDLPAIDNDLYRRGKKTTHAVYGEALGILSGDALLNYAYETASTAFSPGTGESGDWKSHGITYEKDRHVWDARGPERGCDQRRKTHGASDAGLYI